MDIVVAFIIGSFFATCLLESQGLLILITPLIILPFVGGFVLSRVLGWRGWFAYLEPRVTFMQAGLAMLASFVAPIAPGTAVTFLEFHRLELPAGRVNLTRSVGPNRFRTTFLAPSGIYALKVHFEEHHGIRYWHDVPTSDTTDDPDTLIQSVTPSQSQELWILLDNRGEQTFVEVGGPNGKPEPIDYVAGVGLLILFSMIVLGPPRVRIH